MVAAIEVSLAKRERVARPLVAMADNRMTVILYYRIVRVI